MLLAGARDLADEVEVLRDWVGSIGDDMMLQHRKHLHLQRDLPTLADSRCREQTTSALQVSESLCVYVA